MPNPIRHVAHSARTFLTNLDAGPPWPQKIRPLAANRLRALRHGCCGHPGQPGC